MRIAALDIGGTSIKSGIWDGEWASELKEWDTFAARGGRCLMERVKDILHTYKEFDAIGISTAGQVDTSSGSISYANDNIPDYTGIQVRAILEREFCVPVAVENDVNAAALGELMYGAGRGLSDFLCVTYGTGVGGAIVMNGRIYAGSTWAGGSFGGIVVHPEEIRSDAEFSGCYEKYASVTALVDKMMQVDPDLDNGRKIFEAMDRAEVRQTVDCWIDELVYGLITLIHIFNPSVVILGGGILAQPYIIGEVRKRVLSDISPQMRGVCLKNAELGNQAGLIGAAGLAEYMLYEKNL